MVSLPRFCVAHITFRLPPAQDSPFSAAGYAPYDGPALGSSPFMLTVPHSKPGFKTVGLQCRVPSDVIAVPAVLTGYVLTLQGSGGRTAGFTYSLMAGADGAKSTVEAGSTNLVLFLGLAISNSSCAFADVASTALVNGYPTLYVSCVQVVTPIEVNLTFASAMAAAPLAVLMYTATPGSTQTVPQLNSVIKLDGGIAAPCASGWPCKDAAPFGGAEATVLETGPAASIRLLPQGCKGVACCAVAPGGDGSCVTAGGVVATAFPNCPGGRFSSPTSVAYFAAVNGGPSIIGAAMPTVTGNTSVGTTAEVKHKADLSPKSLIIWLAVLTAGLACALVVGVTRSPRNLFITRIWSGGQKRIDALVAVAMEAEPLSIQGTQRAVEAPAE